MTTSQSVSLPLRGQFVQLYRALKQKKLLATTPIVFCEGDSWFSTPLAMNLLDWIVSPAPDDEEKGIPLFGKGGLFFRAEHSGDHASRNKQNPARSMFVERNIDDLIGWFRKFDFDLVLLSAGGNDFVEAFLHETFVGNTGLTADEAYDIVLNQTTKYKDVRDAYKLFVSKMLAAKPGMQILAHTYAYPRLIGEEGKLVVGNIGAVALLKKSVGPWIGPYIKDAIAGTGEAHKQEMRLFVKKLIDGFEKEVLREVKQAFPANFDYVDLRQMLLNDEDWFDEMHPTEAGFHALASVFRGVAKAKLPAAKQ